jgi:hypothetical protein
MSLNPQERELCNLLHAGSTQVKALFIATIRLDAPMAQYTPAHLAEVYNQALADVRE